MEERRKVAIVGSPNVGKSVLFNALAGHYSAAVSNYPGTTVEVSRCNTAIDGIDYEIIDTPGMYSLFPITEEERVARSILMDERPDVVVHSVDARNLERMLPLTFQLIEASLPVILVLNMIDEARRTGMRVDTGILSAELAVPVVATAAVSGEGVPDLREAIAGYRRPELRTAGTPLLYVRAIEDAVTDAGEAVRGICEGSMSERAMALLAIRGDAELTGMIRRRSQENAEKVVNLRDELRREFADPVDYIIAVRLKNEARRIASTAVISAGEDAGFREVLSRLCMHPVAGYPILLLVLYVAIYKFVGGLGAGTVVDFLEGTIFEGYVNPALVSFFEGIIPWTAFRDLFVGEYGVLTLGLRYAVALILPIVAFFFIAFSVIEDSGYLPRLAMLVDRSFKKTGLSGRAVIPLVLGLGCDTMATMVTRTLPTKRERLIACLLLSLAVPCSAQLGVILALLARRPLPMLVWGGTIAGVFALSGTLAARLLPGGAASFYIEVPPLRLPKFSNIVSKTYVRVVWYFKEIMPVFLLVSVIIWLGQLTGLFDLLVWGLVRPVRLLGLPDESATVFLFGFFRRDYGAAGLYDLHKAGLLDGVQLTVAAVALTLFLPCIAQFLINAKERGWRAGLAISGFVLVVAFAVAFVLNVTLRVAGGTL